ncbi:MAG: ABC transporter permease subunit, partial [Flavobacteriaceae bacterium]
MWSIAKRELGFFFSHLIGYLVIGSYLLVSTLILWIFDTPYNLLSIGFGDFSPFFEIAPWLFLFLIPALSMRSFSEERSTGTFELLLTKPLSPTQIFGGKLLGIAFVLLVALLPTFLHLIALDSLLEPNSSLDWGRITGSYVALMVLA